MSRTMSWSSCPESATTPTSGSADLRRRQASIPSIPGIRTSIRTTSGRSLGASSRASFPEVASPTTSMSPVPRRASTDPRKPALSSHTRTRGRTRSVGVVRWRRARFMPVSVLGACDLRYGGGRRFARPSRRHAARHDELDRTDGAGTGLPLLSLGQTCPPSPGSGAPIRLGEVGAAGHGDAAWDRRVPERGRRPPGTGFSACATKRRRNPARTPGLRHRMDPRAAPPAAGVRADPVPPLPENRREHHRCPIRHRRSSSTRRRTPRRPRSRPSPRMSDRPSRRAPSRAAGGAPAPAEPAAEEPTTGRRRWRSTTRKPASTAVAAQEAAAPTSTRLTRTRARVRTTRGTRRRREPVAIPARVTDKLMAITEHGERDQIAVLEGRELVQHYVTRAKARSMVGNVYLGRVQNVLPGMEAAFVDVGRGRNAVLYAGEVYWSVEDLDGAPRRIEHALKSGQSIMVQVTKDPIGGKGARLTAQISLPGRYLVLAPNSDVTGVSRRLGVTERNRL